MKKVFLFATLGIFNFAIAQKTVELKDFSSLTVGSDTEVTMVKSNKNQLVINDSDDDNTYINNAGGSLVLSSDGNYTLYYKNDIENIAVGSDAILECDDEIKSNSLTITAGSDAVVILKINVENLQTTANSDAEVTFTGKAKNHAVVFNSDAELNAKNLVTENTNIVLSSDATGVITAKKQVNATASSDASLEIYGNPKQVNKVVSSDAEVIVK